MGAHKGRCFRQLRRTKRRKARQAKVGYVSPTAGTSKSFYDSMFDMISHFSMVQRRNDQYRSQQKDIKRAQMAQHRMERHQSRGG